MTGRDGCVLWRIPARQGSLPQDEDYIVSKQCRISMYNAHHLLGTQEAFWISTYDWRFNMAYQEANQELPTTWTWVSKGRGCSSCCEHKCRVLSRRSKLTVPQVEWAFLAFHSGQKVHVSPFSWDSHGAIVADYMENLRAFSNRHWMSLLTACGVMDGVAAETFGGPLLDSAQHRLYIPSSPWSRDTLFIYNRLQNISIDK